MRMPFIKGLKLSELLYEEAVGPLLADHFPNLPYSAALIGQGSDVLGFDTPQSTDHDWGPRLMLFLHQSDHEKHVEEIDGILREELPREIHNYPTHFGWHKDGTKWMQESTGGPINHGVTCHTVSGFFVGQLNFDPQREPSTLDWLTFPEQILRSITAGRVFFDGLGQLRPIRARLHYYPDDVWLYLLATQWARISQEAPFMGRCGQVDDEIGSRLVASRLVRDLMRLCFLMERRYAPYIKWFGTAFQQLDCADVLTPRLMQVLGAGSWEERQTALSSAYEFVARKHNELGITAAPPTHVSRFHERPFLVIRGDDFAEAIRTAIISEEVLSLPVNVGAIDQFVDSTDVLTHARRCSRLKAMYETKTRQ